MPSDIPIKPPDGTTPTYYHNKAMDIKYEIKVIDKAIERLTSDRIRLQSRYDALISARENSLKYKWKGKENE